MFLLMKNNSKLKERFILSLFKIFFGFLDL